MSSRGIWPQSCKGSDGDPKIALATNSAMVADAPRPMRIRSAPVYTPTSAEERVERWLAAVRHGSHSAVQSCLRDGWAPVNSTDAAGFTALMRSCVSGQLLSLLLSHAGCDVNATAAADRSTALLIACRHRSARIVNQLLQRGARMTRDRAGATVLHKAAANSDPSVLRLLLQTGAAPYLRDGDGRCPLTAALLLGNQQAALVMLEEVGRCLHGRRAAQAGTAAAGAAAVGVVAVGAAAAITAQTGAAQLAATGIAPAGNAIDTALLDASLAVTQMDPALFPLEPKLARGSTHPHASDRHAGYPAAGAPPQATVVAAAAPSGAAIAVDKPVAAASATSTEALTAAFALFTTGGLSSGGSTDGAACAAAAACARIDTLPDETLDLIVAAAVAASQLPVGAASEGGVTVRASTGLAAGAAGGAPGQPLGNEQAAWTEATGAAAGVAAAAHARAGASGVPATRMPGDTPAAVLRVLSSTSSRFCAACRRFELCRWTSRESLSAPVTRYHPRWQHTTLLHLAAAHGMEEVVVRLMQRGSRVDAVDSCGRTPLQEARSKNQPMMVALLLACEQRRQREEEAGGKGRGEWATLRPMGGDAWMPLPG
jgi:hypothetical protein